MLQVSVLDKTSGEQESGPGKRAALIDSAMEAAADPVAKRQRAWLSRDGSTKPASWRPTKLHRLSTKWWLAALDNQIQVSTQFVGIKHFQFADRWGDKWSEWPGIGLTIDLGSDGVCAYHAMVYLWEVNLWL